MPNEFYHHVKSIVILGIFTVIIIILLVVMTMFI
jgi:hypothetical protein